ncbi:MAG: hypothetical protein WCS99_17835 [Limisphaerales bacterium]
MTFIEKIFLRLTTKAVDFPAPTFVDVYGYLFSPTDTKKWQKEAVKTLVREFPFIRRASFDDTETFEFLTYRPSSVATNELECFYHQTQASTMQKAHDKHQGGFALFAFRKKPRNGRIMVGAVWTGAAAAEAKRLTPREWR